MALSGQTPEAIALCRASLENGLYAAHVVKGAGAADAWMNRHRDDAGKKACRDAFGMSKVWGSLQALDPSLVDIAKRLYEHTIDQGAHPNVYGVMGTVRMTESDEGTSVESVYIASDTLTLNFGLRCCAQVAVACLRIVSGIFPERARELDIPARVTALSEGL